MQYFQFILLNRDTVISSYFSTHTLVGPRPGTVNCTTKRSPFKIIADTVDIIVGIIQTFWASKNIGPVTRVR